MPPGPPSEPPARPRRGEAGTTLLAVAVELAREGGPDAVVLREAARRAGVVPNAAYRHFADRDSLLRAVAEVGMSRLAGEMETRLDAARSAPERDRLAVARACLDAVGGGYLAFALDEPGLFRTTFAVPDHLDYPSGGAAAGPGGLTPYQLLDTTLAELAEAGGLPQRSAEHAALMVWSAVHGLAMLLLEGPLRHLTGPARDTLVREVLDYARRGL